MTRSNTGAFPVGLKAVRLADGGAQAVPVNLEILNPEQEGARPFLYLVWLIDPAEPESLCTFDDSVRGQGVCHPFGYLTEFPDLYITGRHDVPVLRSRFERLVEDWKELWSLMADAVERELPEDTAWAFAYCLCDCMGGASPVGTTYPFVPERASRNEG